MKSENNSPTMKDVAKEAGVSLGTVSKVFNGRGSVPQDTRSLVLQKAKELGYGSPASDVSAPSRPSGNIALLTQFIPSQFHFGSAFLAAFTDRISRAGYTLKIYEISKLVGYSNTDSFYLKFKKHTNMTPKEFKGSKHEEQESHED